MQAQRLESLRHAAQHHPDPRARADAAAQYRGEVARLQRSRGWPSPSGGASREMLDPGHTGIPLDQVHPPACADYIQPLMAPSRYLVVPSVPVVAPQAVTPGERIEFSAGGGWLIGWRGTVRDDTAGIQAAGPYEQASVGVRVFLNDGEELITNGTATDFALFSDLFADATQWSPIMRRVDVKDVMTLQFQNFQPLAGGSSLQPSITFAFWREKYPGAG